MLIVYVRSLKPIEKELLVKILDWALIKEYLIHDLASYDATESDIALAVGKTSERLVAGKAKRIFVISDIKYLERKEDNTIHRQKAIATLLELKKFMDSPSFSEVVDAKNTTFSLIQAQNKVVCIYQGARPSAQADVFIERSLMELMVQACKVFGAQQIMLGEERVSVNCESDIGQFANQESLS